MNTTMNNIKLCRAFADGTGLSKLMLAVGRDRGLIYSYGLAWALTEKGRTVLTDAKQSWLDEDLINQQVRARLDAVSAVPSLLTGESDPLGKHQHETGAKLDAGKPRLGLVLGAFANALVEVGKVGTYGAQKYTDNGWLDVPKGKARYTDALLRHVLAEASGEECDSDTGLSHLAHACWNMLAVLELVLRKRGETE